MIVGTDSRHVYAFAGSSATLTFSGHSDRGAVRRVNEDSFYASAPVFVVADGMGGHSHGDRASQAVRAAFARAFPGGEPSGPERVLDAIRAANADVVAVSAEPGERGPLAGTTITGVALVRIGSADNFHWMAFNVGDSRVYSWDGRTLGQLSVDHSAVQELLDAGLITRAEASVHPARNVVTRALGASDSVDPDIWLLPATGHQRFLICSDGLFRELSDDEIARIIVFHDAHSLAEDIGHRMTLSERLVAAAVAAGGADNVTAVVVESLITGSSDLDEDTVGRGALPRALEETAPRR